MLLPGTVLVYYGTVKYTVHVLLYNINCTGSCATVTELISENAPNLRTVILVRISELGSARTELPE